MNAMRTLCAAVTGAAVLLLAGAGPLGAQSADKAPEAPKDLTEHVDRLVEALTKAAGRGWQARPVRVGQVQPTCWPKGEGVQVGLRTREGSAGGGSSVTVWIMTDYRAEAPSEGPEAGPKPAQELEPWLGRRVFYQGAWPKEKVAAVLTGTSKPVELRAIRVAVFDFDVLEGVELQRKALTDQVNVLLAAMDKVTIVNRDQIEKVADEHKMALSGLVDAASAVRLGKFLSADYVVVGRASRIGQTHYLVMKIVDVGTTVQTTVAAKAAAEQGPEVLLERLQQAMVPKVRRLQQPVPAPNGEALARLRAMAGPLRGKSVFVHVPERHVNRPLSDPAAEVAIANRLRAVGVRVVMPADPPAGWKTALQQTGRYGEQRVDFLLDGEGVSAYAAQLHGMISCRARVELRLIALPGRQVTAADRGVAAAVDLVEALAAKAALEEAGRFALDALVTRYAKLAKGGE